jgi:glycosyltransferase involved in cell wall biosynthesis
VTGSPTVIVASPYRVEYGPPQTLEHVVRALLSVGVRPLCVLPPGARLTGPLRALDPPIREVAGLATVPRTLNPLRLVRFLREHLAAADRIREIAEEEEAVGVYSISEAIFCGGLGARRASIPSLVHVIGMSIRSPRIAGKTYIRILDRLTDTFIACSSAVAELLSEFGVDDEKIAVTHNGIPVSEIQAAAALARPEGLPPGPLIGMVAAFDPRKGHELFVEAAALVADDFAEAQFVLIGGVLEGQNESHAFERRVEALIQQLGLEQRFVRTGFVSRPDVYRYIAALDVVVVPSETEAFAHALLEAMVCARPVVATAIEGNLDAFVDGHSGIYVPRSPSALAAAVVGLLADPERARRMGEAARERARVAFDLGVTLPSIGFTVRELIDQPRSRAAHS